MATDAARATRFPELEVRGAAREMGRQIGEAARDDVRELVELVTERFNKGRARTITTAAALALARGVIPLVEEYAPGYLAESQGVAEAAGVDIAQVMLINTRNQLGAALAARSGCTSLMVNAEAAASGGGIAGQNWDNDPAMDRFSYVITRRPQDGPAVMNWTQPGVIGYMGINSEGVGICLNAMPGAARADGVPWYFIVRAMYEHATVAGIVDAVERARRAIPANAAMMTPEGAVDIEIQLDRVRVLRADESGRLVHTNHCVHPDLLDVNEEFRSGIYGQSFPRKSRAEALLAEKADGVGVDTLKTILADHDGYPTSICRHPNDDPATGWQRSVASLIVEPSAGRIRVSRGNPCEAEYETYEMR